MIILASGSKVAVTVRDSDMLEGNRRYYAFYQNTYYDPKNKFRPCFIPKGEDKRALHDGYWKEFDQLCEQADENFERMRKNYTGYIEKKAEERKPQPQSGSSGGDFGSQLQEMMLRVLAEQSTEKVLELAKPMLDKHIQETYGTLPQMHEVKTPMGTHQFEGVTHERFDTVLSLVANDIPVFLTGAAGTGKNVICQQVAQSLGLEFYFSNAVTQEYKLTGFIDANGHYQETQFYQAFTKGGLFMLDEMDASIPEVLIILNAAIANRYFDFPNGRVDAHKDFRLIAAGNTFGTGADMEYTGRYQLDAASLDRFALITIDYSPKVEMSIANGDEDLVDFIHEFRASTKKAGLRHLATYRAIGRIRTLIDILDPSEVLEMSLFKGMGVDDRRIIINGINAGGKYLTAAKKLIR